MKSRGFTIIEMLATLTVMMILLGGGLAAYLTAQERRQAEIGARELREYFLEARLMARSKDYFDCSTISVPPKDHIGYRIKYDHAQTDDQVIFTPLCGDLVEGTVIAAPIDNDAVIKKTIRTSFESVEPVSLETDYYSNFAGADVDPGSATPVFEKTIQVSNGGSTSQFTVYDGGEITSVVRSTP